MQIIIKIIFFFIPIFFCNIIIYSQNWAPIGAKWTYTRTFPWSSIVDTFVIRSIGDTLIQGKICKVLKGGGTCDLRSATEYTYADSGKIFFYDVSRGMFQMHYNFNAHAGDRFRIFPEDFPHNDSIIIVVDSVSSVIINNVSLKKMYTHSMYCNGIWTYVGGKIIENIGDIWFMFPWIYGGCDADFVGPLRCYQDTLIGFYDFGTASSCDYTTFGIDDNRVQNLISVYPNPVNNIIYIENVEKSNVFIYNLIGENVLNTSCNSNKKTIDLSKLSEGTYIVKVISGKFIEEKKIVIIR